jgi:hypothetical protein
MDIERFDPSEYDPDSDYPPAPYTNEPVVKSCMREHNLARGWNIVRLGTSEGFKEDKSESGDPREGTASFSLDVVSHDSVVRNNHMVIKKISSVYLFCTSLLDEVRYEKNDDKYYINDPNEFMRLIGRQLAQQLQPSDFEDWQMPGHSIYPPYTVYPLINRIKYAKIYHHDNSNFHDAKIIYNATFRKDKVFEPEKEVRIAFQISNPGRKYMLQIKKVPKYIDISSVRSEFDKIVSLVPRLPE